MGDWREFTKWDLHLELKKSSSEVDELSCHKIENVELKHAVEELKTTMVNLNHELTTLKSENADLSERNAEQLEQIREMGLHTEEEDCINEITWVEAIEDLISNTPLGDLDRQVQSLCTFSLGSPLLYSVESDLKAWLTHLAPV